MLIDMYNVIYSAFWGLYRCMLPLKVCKPTIFSRYGYIR